MVAEAVDVVIGVDTHRDSHALALVRVADGGVIGEVVVPANRGGYREALRLAKRLGAGRLWALEGAGCYGAGLARSLAAAGERVVEVERPRRERGRRRGGKSDALDALAAAQGLAQRALATPRAAGSREALRVLLATREGAVATRRAGLNQLRALVVAAPERLRERLHGLPRGALLRSCLRLRPRRDDSPQRLRHAARAALLRSPRPARNP